MNDDAKRRSTAVTTPMTFGADDSKRTAEPIRWILYVDPVSGKVVERIEVPVDSDVKTA